jgi:predicted HAD superfamily phosphohydrolase
MQDTDFDNMVRLAQQKQDLMEEFLKLSEQQAEAISQDSYELVLNIISQKQNIMEQVNLLNLDLPDNMPDTNDSLRIINMKTREIMSRAVAIDDKNIQLLKNNQDQIFEKLINAQKNKKTHAQYRGNNMKIEGMLLDQKK